GAGRAVDSGAGAGAGGGRVVGGGQGAGRGGGSGGRRDRRRRRLRPARSRPRAGAAEPRPGGGGGGDRRGRRQGRLRALPAGRGHRLGQDRGLSGGRGEGVEGRSGGAGADPAARNRPDPGGDRADRGAVRGRPGGVAFGRRPAAAAAGLGGGPGRALPHRGRGQIGPVPALRPAAADRRGRGARRLVQAGGG